MSCDCSIDKAKRVCGLLNINGLNGLNYSFDEVLTDNIYFGKPVYMKCYEITNISGNSTNSVPFNVDNAEVFSMVGTAFNTNYIGAFPNYESNLWLKDGKISIGTRDYRPSTAIITLFYTKSTDSPIE